MAKGAGRAFVVKKNGTTIASVRQKSMTWNGTPIDVTSDDDGGDANYLDGVFGNKTLEISVEGLTDDDVLADLALSTNDADKHLTDLTLERTNGDTVTGDFILTNYVETGQYQEAVTFTATLIRNGTHTLTPGA